MVKRIPATLVVVVLAIGLTATAAFAAGGHAAVAPQVAVATDPPVNVGDETVPPAAGDTDETEAPDTDEDEGDEALGAHPTNHGLIVSQAAQATAWPSDCKNHGQFVSIVARSDATALPTSCAPATDGAAPLAKPHGKPAPTANKTAHPR